MARRKNATPSYLEHSSGKARACWTDFAGIRQERLLPGKFGSVESKEAYARLILEVTSSPLARPAMVAPGAGVTVAEAILAYLQFADLSYRGGELRNIKNALRHVRELYGREPAESFGPLALKCVRQRMIHNGLSRKVINGMMGRIKRAWKWLASEELIPVTAFQALQTVTGLRAGKSEAAERAPVQPVPWERVEATLPHLPPHVATIIRLMWYTGARPAEICQMRLADIDRTGTPWVYRPRSHKTQHHGKQRLIPLGANARAVIAEYLQGRSLNPDDLLFSPARQRQERYERLRATRKTKVQPSQASRKALRPEKLPGDAYTADAISRAVHLACTKHEIPKWFPYQIRHAYGTRVRKDFGLEHAQVSMGHSQANVTQIYAERDLAKALEVAKAIG